MTVTNLDLHVIVAAAVQLAFSVSAVRVATCHSVLSVHVTFSVLPLGEFTIDKSILQSGVKLLEQFLSLLLVVFLCN